MRKVAVGFCCEHHCAQQSERKMHLTMHDPDLAMKSQILKRHCIDREVVRGKRGNQDQSSWLILPGEVFIVERLASPAVVSC